MSPKLKLKEIKKSLKPFFLRLFQYADIDGGKVRVALGYFKKRLKLLFNLKKVQSRADLAKALASKVTKKVRGKKGDAGLALKKMRQRVFATSRGDRPGVQNVIVIITDDKNTGDSATFLQEAAEAKAEGVKIVSLGLARADRQELLAVSSEPSEQNMVYAPKYSDLQKDETVDAVRSKMFDCKLKSLHSCPSCRGILKACLRLNDVSHWQFLGKRHLADVSASPNKQFLSQDN